MYFTAAETNIVVVVAPKPPLIDKVVDKITQPKYEKLDYAGDTPRPHPSEHPDRVPVVVIDPGHGENDTGALSPHSLPEKDANLRLALAVKAELVKRGWKVVMTREDDSFPKLYDRPRVAHREGVTFCHKGGVICISEVIAIQLVHPPAQRFS